jgi:ribonuclease HI
LERNHRVFREEKRTPTQVAVKIKSLFSESASYFIKTSNSKALGIDEGKWIRQLGLQTTPARGPSSTSPYNWEIRLDKNELEEWTQSLNTCILSFDGASKGNPGEAGGGGVIRDHTGNLIARYAWGLGTESNNKAEALALWQGLTQAISLGIQNLTVIGDSRFLIQALNHNTRISDGQLKHIMDKIRILKQRFHAIHWFHVLRGNNTQADEEANKGVRLGKSILILNGVTMDWGIP